MKAKLKLIALKDVPKEGQKVVWLNGKFVTTVKEIGGVSNADNNKGERIIWVEHPERPLQIAPANLSELQQIVCEFSEAVAWDLSVPQACSFEERQIPLRYDYYEEALKMIELEVRISFMDAIGIVSDNNNPKTSVAVLSKEEDNDCWLGVGDGTGNLFVKGSYEAIKRVQKKIFDNEDYRKDSRSWDDVIQDIAKEHNILIDHKIQDYLEKHFHAPKQIQNQ